MIGANRKSRGYQRKGMIHSENLNHAILCTGMSNSAVITDRRVLFFHPSHPVGLSAIIDIQFEGYFISSGRSIIHDSRFLLIHFPKMVVVAPFTLLFWSSYTGESRRLYKNIGNLLEDQREILEKKSWCKRECCHFIVIFFIPGTLLFPNVMPRENAPTGDCRNK